MCKDANEQTDGGHPGVGPAAGAAFEPGAEFSQGFIADAELAGVQQEGGSHVPVALVLLQKRDDAIEAFRQILWLNLDQFLLD